jgi:leader peptidase (prepilin peptidase) / N-methyltransferase
MDLMAWFLPVLAAPFIGSFLGVVILRLSSGSAIVWGRSACASCDRVLGPLDLFPIVSWLALRGRCRHCHALIGSLTLAVELGAVIVALWAASLAEGTTLWATCALGWVLLALAAIDFREEWLPDMLTLPLLAGGLLVNDLDNPSRLVGCVVGAVVGFAVFAAIRWAYRRWRGHEGLGLGDAKLLAAAGAWLSWEGLPSVVLLGAVIGLMMALIAAWRGGRSVALDQRLPFGPALCAAIWLVWLYGPLVLA